jgi:voltage-gated potassium channel
VQRVEESTEAAVESAEILVRADVRNLLVEVAALRQELAELRRERER